MRPDCVEVAPPTFDDDLGLTQRVEYFAIEQFISQATSLTPIWRMTSAMSCPCDIKTSACRSFATISSGLCFFFGISVLLHVKRHSSGRTTFQGEDHRHVSLVMLAFAMMAVIRHQANVTAPKKTLPRLRTKHS